MNKLPLLFALLLLSSCSKNTIGHFIDDVKENRSAYAVTVPGWLISLGMKALDDQDEEAIISLGKKIKKVRVVVDQKAKINATDINQVIAKMQEEDQYTPYTIVRRGEDMVYVMVKEEKEEKVSDLVIMAHGDESIVIVNLKTDLSMKELREADFSFNKDI